MSGLRSWQTDRIKFYTIGVDNFYCIVIMSKLQLLIMRLLISLLWDLYLSLVGHQVHPSSLLSL